MIDINKHTKTEPHQKKKPSIMMKIKKITVRLMVLVHLTMITIVVLTNLEKFYLIKLIKILVKVKELKINRKMIF